MCASILDEPGQKSKLCGKRWWRYNKLKAGIKVLSKPVRGDANTEKGGQEQGH
jgi:hypothetical protein